MDTFITKFFDWTMSLQDVSWMPIAAAILFIGFMFLIPIKPLNDFAKNHVPLVMLGAFLIFCATDIGKDMSSSAGFYKDTGMNIVYEMENV